MFTVNVLTVRPILLTGDGNCAQEQRKSRLRLWSVDEAKPGIGDDREFYVLMTLVIGRVHR